MNRYIGMSLAIASLVMFAKRGGDEGAEAPAETITEEVAADPVAETKTSKSIVPSKYAGKYKGGGSDVMANFIKSQAEGKDGFEFPAFFQLCRLNGLDETKVAHYESLVASKVQGANGRARMTLRNMLETPARKNGKLVNLAGEEVAIELPKRALGGAAAAAKEASGEQATA